MLGFLDRVFASTNVACLLVACLLLLPRALAAAPAAHQQKAPTSALFPGPVIETFYAANAACLPPNKAIPASEGVAPSRPSGRRHFPVPALPARERPAAVFEGVAALRPARFPAAARGAAVLHSVRLPCPPSYLSLQPFPMFRDHQSMIHQHPRLIMQVKPACRA